MNDLERVWTGMFLAFGTVVLGYRACEEIGRQDGHFYSKIPGYEVILELKQYPSGTIIKNLKLTSTEQNSQPYKIGVNFGDDGKITDFLIRNDRNDENAAAFDGCTRRQLHRCTEKDLKTLDRLVDDAKKSLPAVLFHNGF